MLIWKGKGILVILYFIASTIVVAIVGKVVIDMFDLNVPRLEVGMGIVLIVTGIWTKLTAEDYYIDKEGRKKYLDIENSLFFIQMNTWGLILPCIGAGLIVYGL